MVFRKTKLCCRKKLWYMLCWNFNVELDIFASSANIHTVYMKWNNKKLFQSYQFFFWLLKSLCMWSRLGARCPPCPALPCHIHTIPLLCWGCVGWHLWRSSTNVCLGQQSLPFISTGWQLVLCTKQKTIRAAISKICKPQHCWYLSLPITKTHLGPSRILTSLSQRWHIQ